jgi:hypothetical protein
MNSDFIKWVFDKAGEPFKVTVFPNITMIDFPIYEHSKDINDFEKVCPDWLKSFLWQKAIEGVNREARFEAKAFIIEQSYTSIKVYDWAKTEFCMATILDDNNEKNAKEAALKYIWEQETL